MCFPRQRGIQPAADMRRSEESQRDGGKEYGIINTHAMKKDRLDTMRRSFEKNMVKPLGGFHVQECQRNGLQMAGSMP